MSKYRGIDLHSNNCVVVVSDEDDRICCEKRVPNELAKIVALLEPFRTDLVSVAVESTFNWYWLVDGLRAAGFDVKLVNTAAIVEYEGLKYRGDEHDARHLAHLLRLDLRRAVRDLARKRLQLVRTRTIHILALETLYARQTGGRLGGSAAKALDVEDVARWEWSDDATLAAQVMQAPFEDLDPAFHGLYGHTLPMPPENKPESLPDPAERTHDELVTEVNQLRMEVAYLKKLRALVQAQQQQRTTTRKKRK